MLRLLRTQLVTPKGLDGDLAGRENRAPLDRGRLRADATETMRENIQYTLDLEDYAARWRRLAGHARPCPP